MIEAIAGMVTAIALIFVYSLLSKYFTAKLFAATTLVAIAFIYVGFSLKDNSTPSIILEVGVALVFYFLAIFGYKQNSSLIALGIILHGVWDIFHHEQFLIDTSIPVYWPTFCFIIDIVDGLYFLWIFRKEKRRKII